MSNRTSDINKITTAIISISLRLILYVLIILLLYEAVVRGFAFGHSVFYAEAVEEAPGHDITVVMEEGESVSEAAKALADKGLIKSEAAFLFQSRFYDYDTIYPGTYALNTSMTSKEILQLLNEKPEEETEESQGAAAARTAEPSAQSEETQGQEAAVAAEAEAEAADSQESAFDGTAGEETETEETYAGEEQEEEGGWIEDAAEDTAQ